MSRFEQRLRKRLQNPEIAAELELMCAIDEARREQHMSQEKLAPPGMSCLKTVGFLGH